jgi:hypothetical protein
MEANNLRLSNLIQRNKIGKVTVIDGDFITTDQEHDVISCFKGVPLSFEWFEKMGFTKNWLDENDHTEGCYYKMRLSDNIYDDLCLMSGDKNGKVECYLFPFDTIRWEFVHEVQNIYADITKKDLKIDEILPDREKSDENIR